MQKAKMIGPHLVSANFKGINNKRTWAGPIIFEQDGALKLGHWGGPVLGYEGFRIVMGGDVLY